MNSGALSGVRFAAVAAAEKTRRAAQEMSPSLVPPDPLRTKRPSREAGGLDMVLEPLEGFESVIEALGATVAPEAVRVPWKITSPVCFKPDPSPRQELAYRELCRRRLAWFTARHTPGYDCGWVHWHLARRLEKFRDAVSQRSSPRLMVFFPPRTGKTRETSICFPAQTLGEHPDWDLILTSYSSDLAERNSREVRELINSSEYGALYPEVAVAHHARAVNEWETNWGGHVRAAGVGGSILGMGAHVFVVDDPIKNAEEADSDVSRQSLWGWYGAVATTRLAPGAGVVLIQQRWRFDDLAGQLLSGQSEAEALHNDEEAAARALYADRLREAAGLRDAGVALDLEELSQASAALRDARDNLLSLDRWEVFKYPALAVEDEFLDSEDRIVRRSEIEGDPPVLDPSPLPDAPPPGSLRLLRRKGDALHAQRYDRLKLLRHKNAPATQPRHWSAMYQQDPRVEEGAYFNPADLRWRKRLGDAELSSAQVFMTGDMAISEKKKAKKTAYVVLARLENGHYVLLDWVSGRWGTTALLAEFERMVRRWRPCKAGLEREKIMLTFMPTLKKHLKEKHLRVRFDEDLVPVSDKEARARPLQGACEKGIFWIVGDPESRRGKELSTAFSEFPLGAGLDVMDALAWAVRLAEKNPQSKLRRKKAKLNGVELALKDYGATVGPPAVPSSGGGHMAA